MTLKLTTGHLTRTATNHLAFCNDCLCNVFEPSVGDCQCASVDYGPRKTLGTLTVEVSGSMTPQAATSPACSAPASCASVNGTYVIACDGDTDQIWRIDGFVCTSGGVDYYYSSTLRIIYQPINAAVTIRIGSSKTTHVTNPYPTLTLVGTQPVAGTIHQWAWSESLGVVDRWTYELGGTCRESCNFAATIRQCPSTSGSLTLTESTFSGPSSTDCCDPSTLTVTASLTAAA